MGRPATRGAGYRLRWVVRVCASVAPAWRNVHADSGQLKQLRKPAKEQLKRAGSVTPTIARVGEATHQAHPHSSVTACRVAALRVESQLSSDRLSNRAARCALGRRQDGYGGGEASREYYQQIHPGPFDHLTDRLRIRVARQKNSPRHRSVATDARAHPTSRDRATGV